MKKIVILLCVMLMIILQYQIISTKDNGRPFNKVSFNDNNKVLNKVGLKYMDTVVLAGLNRLDIKNTNVLIKEFKIESIEDIETIAYIEHIGTIYIIWIRKIDKEECIEVLSHELIHLKQYINNRVEVNDGHVVWLGNKILNEDIPEYLERPWELEAFAKQGVLKNKIENILYN